MRIRTIADSRYAFVGVIVAVMSMLVSTASTAACWSGAEIRAQKVLELRMMLMVGALQCGFDPALEVRENYNRFVIALAGPIRSQEQLVARRLGRGFDAHKTRVANSYSTVDGQVAFCGRASTVARDAVLLQPTQLASFADAQIEPPRIEMAKCPVVARSTKKKRRRN